MCRPDEFDPGASPHTYVTRPHLKPRKGSDLVIEPFVVHHAGKTYAHGKLCFCRGRSPKPVILVHANYAGLKQFDVDVAAFLALSGYTAVAVDLYEDMPGVYSFADRNPADRNGGAPTEEMILRHQRGSGRAMDLLLRNPKAWRSLLRANLEQAFAHPMVLAGEAAAIGYCLGGQVLLEQVRAGHPLRAAVAFHGLLHSRPRHPSLDRRLTPEEFARTVDVAPNRYNRTTRVLIEHGNDDVRDGRDAASIAAWKAEMDREGIDWRMHVHARTPHGFALPRGVWSNAYTEDADRRSTLDMMAILAETWPDVPQFEVAVNACGTTLLGRRRRVMASAAAGGRGGGGGGWRGGESRL